MLLARSPSSSPIRKKQRLSSPTYDDQIGDLSQDCLDAFDEIEFTLSQAQPPHARPHVLGPSADLESPFLVTAAYTDEVRSSQYIARRKEPLLQPPDAFPLFQSARTVDITKVSDPAPLLANKENEGVLRPSTEALRAAQAKLKSWERDWEDLDILEGENGLDDFHAIDIVAPLALESPLKPLREMLPPASTPIAQFPRSGFGFSSQSCGFRPLTLKAAAREPALSPVLSTITSSQLPRTPRSTAYSTPSRMRQPLPSGQVPSSLVSTPRSIGISRKARSSFVSPFKSHQQLHSTVNPLMKTQLQNRIYPPAGRPTPSPLVEDLPQKVVSRSMESTIPIMLHPLPSNRKTLLSSGLIPQRYSIEELEAMDLNVAELSSVKPSTALHYCFYSFTSTLSTSSQEAPIHLNSAAAYQELLKQGCRLATEEWVNNHWCLILWKLAGMAALDPSSEKDPGKKRWCWEEVMRQLRYRYDVELDGGKRPILRRIVAQDSPANIPLVLCISAVIEVDGGYMLEVTDGWYRLRAEIDAPLARAFKKGMIREGRKIIVSGARLNSEKKDPMEILEAYNSVTLKISANSSNLAPWHAKLGNQKQRYVSTLHSLTPDGGLVSCLDIEILKVHPVGHIQFIEQDGRTTIEGPRNEAEEAKVADEWTKRRDKEVSKLRQEHNKRVSRYMDYLSRLEGKAQKGRTIGEDEDCPDYIDNYYDDLEEHASALQRIGSITQTDAHWLAQLVRQNLETEHERINAEIEKDIVEICPPRNVRNFRVLVVKDARTEKRASNRVAQLTVWEADHFDMSTSWSFAPGQRYLVSNLTPTQPKVWMKEEKPVAEVFMQTRKDSQWLKRKAVE